MNDIISNTLASIYDLSGFKIGFFDLNLLRGDLSNFAFNGFVNNFKIISALFSAVFLILYIINFIKIGEFLKPTNSLIKTINPPETAKESPLGARWEEIQRHLNSNKEAEWKFAVIEADNLVDYVLKASGYPGDTMGERLKNIDKSQIVTLDTLWEAHKIRNRLAHDPNYFLRYGEAKRAIQLYEKTLKELNAL
jgi:hypothetical protein